MTMRTINQCSSLPPGVVGIPFLEVFKKDWTIICPGWNKDFCFGQGLGLKDLQVPSRRIVLPPHSGIYCHFLLSPGYFLPCSRFFSFCSKHIDMLSKKTLGFRTPVSSANKYNKRYIYLLKDCSLLPSFGKVLLPHPVIPHKLTIIFVIS